MAKPTAGGDLPDCLCGLPDRKVKENPRVSNKAVYLALGVPLSGNKGRLRMWLSQNEGAKFWLVVLAEPQNRGVNDMFIACMDGLTGFREAIESFFPQTRVQLQRL